MTNESNNDTQTKSTSASYYPPEIVVLATPDVSSSPQIQALLGALCTRIITVEYIPVPTHTIDDQTSKRVKTSSTNFLYPRMYDNHTSFGLTKLQIFNLTQYHTIVYIDNDCLVTKDVSTYLLGLGKVYVESESLVAAAPDVFPPDHFNSGVMVIRPNHETYQNMLDQRSLLSTTDGTDTGYLNAYFSEWYTKMPPDARLGIGYNAQQVLYDMSLDRNRPTKQAANGAPKKENGTTEDASGDTTNNISTYWDMSIAPDLHIIHYSSLTKPWEKKHTHKQQSQDSDGNFHPHMSMNGLDDLWWSWHQKSKNYLTRYKKEKETEERAKAEARQRQQQKQQKQQQRPAASASTSASNANNPKTIHKLIARRFKELRSQGMDTKQAMEQARDELQPEPHPSQQLDAGSQVAAMFGLR